jgi:peptidoglycan/LPS O-acetylase OafA/YrhL
MTALPVETSTESKRARMRGLDGLRGVAALGVMLYHFAMQTRPEHAPLEMLKLALIAGPRLDLFFVLSGFLITGLLYDSKRKENYYRNFYARRMLRILPLYYGALTILFVMPYLVPAPGAAAFRVPFEDQIWYWLYLQNFRPLPPVFIGLAWHLWSLAIEQQFYLVWPIVILNTSRETALKICGALIVTSILYRTFGSFEGVGARTVWPTPSRLDGIAVGSALALMLRGPKGLEPARKMLLPIFAVAVGYISWYVSRRGGDRTDLFPLYFTSTAVFFGCMVVYAMYIGDGITGRLLKSRALAFFGKYGYGLYVFHVPLVSILAIAGINPVAFSRVGSELVGALAYFVLMIAVTTGVALLSWHLWEKQFLKLRPFLTKS